MRKLIPRINEATLSSLAETMRVDAIDKNIQAFLDKVAAANLPPLSSLSYENARRVLSAVQKTPTTKPQADIRDLSFPVGPTKAVNVRVVRPAQTEGLLPVVMYFHGGGWVMGNPETHDRLIRDIANGANVAVVFVDYTPAPDAKLPVQNEQAYAATRYVAEFGNMLGLDGTRIAVAGDDAGGNMAAAVALMAKERGGPWIRFQLLFYPILDDVSQNASYKTFSKGPWLTAATVRYFIEAAVPKELRGGEQAFPLRAPLTLLRGLPETLLILAEKDILRDEGEAYAHKLRQAGVHVTSTRYNGMIHDFVLLNCIAHISPVRAAIAQACVSLRMALRA